MMKVSVIIPVYNVEKHLPKCITSVLNQSYDDIEIVLVNDCSSDASVEICRFYEEKFSTKIHLIDKPLNEGVDHARFSGLYYVFESNPDGYVTFVDSDDWLENDAIKIMMSEIIDNNADVASMQFYRCLGPVRLKVEPIVPPGMLKSEQLMGQWFHSFFGHCGLPPYMWGKIYKVKTIKDVHLEPTGFKMGEDLFFNMRLLPFVHNWVIVDFYGYNYRWGGVTSGFNPLWPELRDQYVLKCAFAQQYHLLESVKTLLAVELKNIFYTDVFERKKYTSEREFHEWIIGALNDVVWNSVQPFPDYERREFEAIAAKDIPLIIKIAYRKAKQPLRKTLVVKLLSLFVK